MEIKGYGKSIRNKKVVKLPRSNGNDIELTVFAVPPDYGDELERELPTPKPGFVGFFRGGKKQKVEFDAAGQPVKMYDDDDPDFLKKLRTIQQLQTIKMVRDSLDPDEVTFDTPKDDREPIAFYTSIRDEMKTIGLSAGDIEALGKAISEVSNMNIEKILEARADFFERESSRSYSVSTPSVSDKDGPTNKSGGSSQTAKEPVGSRS